jgi:hypothetical protein
MHSARIPGSGLMFCMSMQPHFPSPDGVADAHIADHLLMTSRTPIRRANHTNCKKVFSGFFA